MVMKLPFAFPCIIHTSIPRRLVAVVVVVVVVVVVGVVTPLPPSSLLLSSPPLVPPFQVLGHLKTVLILLLGFLLFGYHVDLRQCVGIVLAMVGVVSYTEVKRKEMGVGSSSSKSSGGGSSSATHKPLLPK